MIRRPRTVVHRGHVEASGFILHFNAMTPAEARRRILSLWERDGRVYSLKDGLLFLTPRPAHLDVNQTIGLPLVQSPRGFSAAPIPANWISDGMLAEVRGGELVTRSLATLPEEDPSAWISIEGMTFEEGLSLGEPPTKPTPVIEPRPVNIRETLKGIPQTSPGTRSLLGKLAISKPPSAQGGRELFRSFLQHLLSLLPKVAPVGNQPVRSKPPSKLSVFVNHAFGRLLMMTKVARVLGWRQYRQLAETMRMFESGDLNEALRNAIPLSAIEDSPALKISFGLPTRRSNLQIQPWAYGTSASILANSLYADLAQLYEAAFRRLEAQGRIDEAAFVLAELLRRNHEAVAFLEKHGRLREAAELAEGRGLEPAMVIRQWYVAGDKERALLIARKTGLFAIAIAFLEKKNDPLALPLRGDWAQILLESGNPAAAVDALWPVESERPSTLPWLQDAIELGGTGAARSLARAFLLCPEEFEQWRDRALPLLRNDVVEDAPLRLEFIETLRRLPSTAQTRTIAREAVRAALRDAANGHPIPGDGLQRLAEYSWDSSLRADLPRNELSRRTDLKYSPDVRQHVLSATDRGLTEIHDAVPLPSGGYVLALGEAGVKIVNREGRVVAAASPPAHRIVLSRNGSRAIAMAQRGKTWMLSKLDVSRRTAKPWCLAELSGFVNSYDGDRWYVASGRDLYVIDATADAFNALWRIPDLGHVASPLVMTTGLLSLITRNGEEWWLWRYQLPNMRLSEKLQLSGLPSDDPSVVIAPCGANGLLSVGNRISFRQPNSEWIPFTAPQLAEIGVRSFVSAEHWLAIVFFGANHSRVAVFSLRPDSVPALRLEVRVDGDSMALESHAKVRLEESTMTIIFGGRVQTYGLTSGDLVSRYRTTAF